MNYCHAAKERLQLNEPRRRVLDAIPCYFHSPYVAPEHQTTSRPDHASLPTPTPPNSSLLRIQSRRQHNRIEPNVLPTALNKPPRAQQQRLLAEHVLVRRKLAARQRALAPPVQLPQRLAVVALDEADVVQVDVVRRLRRRRVALAGCGVVRAREVLGGLEEAGARGWVEREGLFEELVEGGVGFCKYAGRRVAMVSLGSELPLLLCMGVENSCYVRMLRFAGPLATACSKPIIPHALRIVCLNHTTGSSAPLALYSGRVTSSARRVLSYAAETGKTRRRACAGRGRKASSSGSVRL